MKRLCLTAIAFFVPAVISTAFGIGCGDSSSSSSGNDASVPTPTPGTPGAGEDGGAGDGAACTKLPATGGSQVLPPRTDGSEIGARAGFAIDKKGRPVFAFFDQPESGVASLFVVTWDDCTGSWRTPVKVDDNTPNEGARVVSISADQSDGRIGIAYVKSISLKAESNDTSATFVAISTDGIAFTSSRVSKHAAETDGSAAGDVDQTDHPQIVLNGGKTYVAYNQGNIACGTGPGCADGTVLATQTSQAGAFTYEHVKDGVDADHNGEAATRKFTPGLAVDSDGKPAVVVHIEPPTAYNTKILFWRQGATGVVVTDSNNVQNDDGEASLGFDGKKPRVVTRLQRGAIGANNDYDLVFSASDDGTTWAAPVALPRPEAISPSQNVLAANGKVTVVAGGPHVFTSTDLTTFTASADAADLVQGANAVTGAFDASGKLWIGFEGTSPKGSGLGGIALYRQP